MSLIRRCAPLSLLLILVGTLAAYESGGGDRYTMRWRIFCDHESQTAFRFPYDYRMPDQYAARLRRPGSGGGDGWIEIQPGVEMTPERMAELVRESRARAADDADIWHVHTTAGELPAAVDASDLEAVLAHLSEGRVTAFEPFDYYGDVDNRPHGDPEWAPEGVGGVIGVGPDHCAILLASGDRFAALVATGAVDEHENREIFATFEVLSRERERDPLMTWREKKTVMDREVISYRGEPVSVRARAEPVDWDQAWEAESANYHITCTSGPGRAYYFAMLMEALYVEFASVFRPEAFPPYKMEIHILDTVDEFAAIANAKGFGPVSTGRGGSLTGGFFVPSQLCIYTFNQPVPRFPDMTVEKVLAHEASHQFLHVACNGSRHVPTWINEGLAVYFESGEFDRRGNYSWQPPQTRMAQLKQYYAQTDDTIQPLDQYLEHYGHIPAIAYAEVYAMTHFWIFGAEGGRERFVAYWNALKAGENGTEAFERIFMEDLIAAHGSRRAAVQVWEEMMFEYVMRGYSLRRPRR